MLQRSQFVMVSSFFFICVEPITECFFSYFPFCCSTYNIIIVKPWVDERSGLKMDKNKHYNFKKVEEINTADLCHIKLAYSFQSAN